MARMFFSCKRYCFAVKCIFSLCIVEQKKCSLWLRVDGLKDVHKQLGNGFSFKKTLSASMFNAKRSFINCFKGERTIKGVRIHMPQTHSHFILFLSKCMICKPKCALHMNMVHLLIILLKSHTLEPYSH